MGAIKPWRLLICLVVVAVDLGAFVGEHLVQPRMFDEVDPVLVPVWEPAFPDAIDASRQL
jgi:hypothetical protein